MLRIDVQNKSIRVGSLLFIGAVVVNFVFSLMIEPNPIAI
jgi:hypothetical protein